MADARTAPAECEHLARTSAYFDGALAPDEEAAAADHLAGCAECQALLGDAVGLDAALHGAPPASSTAPGPAAGAPSRRRRRAWLIAAGALAAAAAAALWIELDRRGAPSTEPPLAALDLPRERALEARFTGPRFGAHRTLGVLRGADRAREPIGLAALADLERRGELHDLVAATASAGDLARAEELAARLPAGAAADADRAAVAVSAGDFPRALRHAYRALDREPGLAAARWNLALAARGLDLPRVARAAFDRLAAAGEPGWAEEARRAAAALEPELAAEAERFGVGDRGDAMIDGGAPLTAEDVARSPAHARLAFVDAVRVAPDRARLEALRPLAAALDAASGTAHATAMLDRADPALGARFGAGYRALLRRQATPEEQARLLADLRAAGPRAAYLRVGAIILAGQGRAAWAELRDLVAPWRDPWFDLHVERERIGAVWPPNDIGAAPPLEAALARCTGAAWSLRCGQLALDLATLLAATGRDDLAAERAADAVARFRTAGIRMHLARARAFVAELRRRGGSAARARAEFEEIGLATPTSDCDLRRYAAIGEAGLAISDGAWDAARARLPAAAPGEGCSARHDDLGLATAADLARRTGEARDLERARQWIERADASADGGLALVGLVRIARGADPASARQLAAWIRMQTHATRPEVAAVRAWGIATLIADAGARSAWSDIIALAALDHPAAAQARCAVVASVDVDAVTVAVRVESALSGAHRVVPLDAIATTAIVPDALAASLAGCADVAVVARPPLHGRADLLPPQLPWWFAGDTAGAAPRPGPARAIEITDARPPDPTLPRLAPAPSAHPFDAAVTGPDATPARVLAALADATYAELHVHGIAAASDGDAAYLALSPDATGAFALRAAAVRDARLRRAPLVVLGACRAATVAPYVRQRWSLPDAFLAAGASAVIAADVPIADASARRTFDELHRRVAAGEPVAAVVAALRAAAPPDAAWARRLMVFR